jgi:predicted phage baseplate assembly protein
LSGQRLCWLRCRVTGRSRDGKRIGYRRPPEVTTVSALVAGATGPASHAATVHGELLSASDGIAGAVYPLRRRPVLAPQEGETLEVREPGSDRWIAWTAMDSFSLSGHSDRHFLLDTVRGEVRFGPAIRQPDGGWRRYGEVPPAGASMRFTRYRHGGGTAGNVAPRALTILSQPVAGVAGVTNPRAATGGVEAESLQSARDRARLEVRARSRAVTAEDFERFTLAASPQVARAVCVAPDDSGPIRVHVLPQVAPADRLLELSELVPDEQLLQELAQQLDVRRLLGTSIALLPVRLRGVSIVADVRASPLADLERVQQDVAHALYVYLNPLIGGSPGGPGDGWPLGRALNQGELFGIVYGISGVEFVNILRMYETDIATGEQAPQPTESHLILEADELIASGRHIVKAIYRE